MASAPVEITIMQGDPQAQQQQQPGTKAESFVDDGMGNKQAPERIKNALIGLWKHFAQLDRFPRRQEVIDARRQRFYDRGYQYIYFNSTSYVFVPIVGGVSVNIGNDNIPMPRYTNVYNIFKPYRRNFMAPLIQNPPGITFEPDNFMSPLDQQASDIAKDYVEHVKAVNPQRKLQSRVARLFWTDGRVIFWSRHVNDEDRWGVYEQTAEQQQSGEMPDYIGQPKGEELINAYGVLEAKVVPITANEIDDVIFASISDDPEINIAKHEYPDIADKIKAGPTDTGESSYERNARLGVLQGTRLWAQSADSFSHLTTRHHCFLRPDAYQQAPDDIQEALDEMFPDGVRLCVVSDQYAEAHNCMMEDELTIAHALDGDGMNRPSWGRDLVAVQDAYNNYTNKRQEINDYGDPLTIIHPQCIGLDALRELVSQPGGFVHGTLPQGMASLEQAIFRTEPETAPSDLIQAQQDLRDAFAQFVTGVQPAMFGGKISGDDKVGTYAMAREQAMGVMALAWGNLQDGFADAYGKAVQLAAKNRPEGSSVSIQRQLGKGKSVPGVVSIGDLKKGSFHCKPSSDSSMPETTSARKAAFQEFMAAAEFNPVLAEAAVQPDNIELGRELQRLPELVIPAALARNKQLEEIDRMLKEPPIPDLQGLMQAKEQWAAASQMAQAGGMPPPPEPDLQQFMKSSVDVFPYNYNGYEKLTCQDWLNGPECAKQLRLGNDQGVQNIVLHWQAHKDMEQQQQAQQTPPMPLRPPVPGAQGPPAVPPTQGAM